jgi:hypothetical protein
LILFIWDFLFGNLMEDIMQWCYEQAVGFFGNFFSSMGMMGADLFDIEAVQAIVLFFRYLGWALFVIGLVVAAFETGINALNGRRDYKETALNAIKGFMAAGLFSIVPVELYKLAVSLQGSLTAGITGYGDLGSLAQSIMDGVDTIEWGISDFNPIMMLFIVILIGYAVVKVFFGNLKRGGILLVQIAVGSLYMFSVPRGYIDGFTQWAKQVIGLCLTAFMQATMLTIGLLAVPQHPLLGLGMMLAAGEVPRIAGQFGLDTGTRANIMSAVYTAQAAVNMTKTVVQAVAK